MYLFIQPLEGVRGEDTVHVNNDQQQPSPAAAGDSPNIDTSTYGPKAVLKNGVLGNFEPVIKPQTGPGMCGRLSTLSSRRIAVFLF